MKVARISLVLLALSTLVSVIGVAMADDDDESGGAKYTIKEVMNNAHKSGLLKKVLAGDASQQEKLELLDSYISLLENEPPKGDLESWHNLAGRATLAAAKVVVNRDGAVEELKATTKCATCHKSHKGA